MCGSTGAVESVTRTRVFSEGISLVEGLLCFGQVWAQIPQRFIQRYIVSMRARCAAVIVAGGGLLCFGQAGVSMHSKIPLVNIQENLNAVRYQQDTIQPVVIPYFRVNRGLQLAQDNAPCHATRGTQAMLA